MKLRTWFLALTLCVLPVAGMAQFDLGGWGGGNSSRPWEGLRFDQNKRVSLNFRNANPDLVISVISQASGITIVKHPSLTSPMTVASPQPVPLNEAFQIFSSTLRVMGYNLVREGNLLMIEQQQRGNQGGRPGGGGGNQGQQNPWGNFDPSMLQGLLGGGESQSEVRVYPVKYANASQVARVVNDVYAQMQSNNPMQMLSQMAMQFMGGQRGQQGRGMPNFGRGQQGVTVRASSDDYSNQVIINAPRDQHQQIARLIEQLDIQAEETQRPIVYPLTYAGADELAPIVQNVLTANAPLGRGGVRNPNQQIPFEQRIGNAMRFGNSQAGFGTVVAEPRTNSLIVTATDDNHRLVARVIEELDQEVVIEPTTFVVPLNNARADQVSQLLFQAFGNRQGAGGANMRTGTGFGGNFGGQQNRNLGNMGNRSNFGNQGNRGGLGGGMGNRTGGRGGFAPLIDDEEIQLMLADPDADFGELATEVYAQMQFGGAMRQPQTQRAGQTGRDEQGRLVNVRDLQGQVTVIPDPNTNSLIVVTTPENAELLQNILQQLDRIPEQVMIETVIVEATLDASTKLGVEWAFTQERAFGNAGTRGQIDQDFGLRTNTADPARGFKYSLTGGNLDLFLNALKTDSRFEVLSTPRIFTSNNVQAQINISQSVPYVLSSREDPNGNLTFTYAFQDVGIVLTVTPRITANGFVTMDVVQTANDLQGFTTFNAPIVNQRQANTTVSVRDGETIILGGIIRSTVSSTTRKIPILGDIPILGNLFRTTDKNDVKTELLVFLTPRVVRDPEDASSLREEMSDRLSPATRRMLDRAIGSVSAAGQGGNGVGIGTGTGNGVGAGAGGNR